MTVSNRLAPHVFGLTLLLSAGPAAADVVAVVSAKSAVSALSKTELRDIFLGKVSRFPDGTIATPVDLTEGSLERDEFYQKLVGKSPAQIKAYWSKLIFTGRGLPPKTVASTQEMKKHLADSPAAIGYLERSAIDGSLKVAGAP
jgi:ABC-type phosphate transport system substrate-binding protein